MGHSVQRKIVTPAQLADVLGQRRAAGETVVQCHGCFDIVHPGHVRYLQFARQMGDILVVSLTGDPDVAKGPDRPYIAQELRAENLAAFEFVDWVVVDSNPTACELLELLRPDVYVKGREYANTTDARFLREREIVERHGGRVVFHSGDVVFSSTSLIGNLERDPHLEEARLRNNCRRAGINAESIRTALGRADGLRVVVVGDLVWERYILCDMNSPAGRGATMNLQRIGKREYWGGAAALALQLHALGARPLLVTSIGRDRVSRRIARRLQALPIDTHLLPERPSVVRRDTFVADDNKLYEVNTGNFTPLDSTAERGAGETLTRALADAKLLIWCDHGYGMVTPGLVQAVGNEPREHGLFIAGHAPGQRARLTGLLGCDLLTVTERRLRETTNDMSSGLSTAAYCLLTSTRSDAVIVDLHKRGLLSFDGRRGEGEDSHLLPRLKTDFVPTLTAHYTDLSGAEEALLAASALMLAGGSSLALATYIACAAQSIAVARPGGHAVHTDELHAFLGRRPEVWPDSHFVADPLPHRGAFRTRPAPDAPPRDRVAEETEPLMVDWE